MMKNFIALTSLTIASMLTFSYCKKYNYGVYLQNIRQEFISKIIDTDASYLCMAQCVNSLNMKRHASVPVFTPTKPNLINCNNKFPDLEPACKSKVKSLQFTQYGQNFYYVPNIKLNWHGARKMCISLGLEFGDIINKFKNAEVNVLLDNIKKSTKDLITNEPTSNTTIDIKLWVAASDYASSPTYWENTGDPVTNDIIMRNEKPSCISVIRAGSKALKLRQENCKTEYLFFCTIPSECFLEECFAMYVNKTVYLPTFKNLLRFKLSKSSSVTTNCESQDCKKFKCRVNPNIFTPNGQLIVNTKKGVLINACGKQLYFSSDEKEFDASYTECCSLNMSLISILVQEKVDCIYKLFEGTGQLPTAFWTSGTDAYCKSNFQWCTLRTKFNNEEVPWMLGEPSGEGELNVVLYLSQYGSGLIDWYWRNKLRFICESDLQNNTKLTLEKDIKNSLNSLIKYNTTTRIVPQVNYMNRQIKLHAKDRYCYNLCKKQGLSTNVTFDADGNLHPNQTVGHLVEACGGQYLFSKKEAIQAEAVKSCCSFGMQLAIIDSQEELNCLADTFLGLGLPGVAYWIAVVDDYGERKFVNCDANFTKINEEFWLPGEPNNAKVMIDEMCAVVRLSPSGIRGFADRGCVWPYFYLCEKSSNTKENVASSRKAEISNLDITIEKLNNAKKDSIDNYIKKLPQNETEINNFIMTKSNGTMNITNFNMKKFTKYMPEEAMEIYLRGYYTKKIEKNPPKFDIAENLKKQSKKLTEGKFLGGKSIQNMFQSKLDKNTNNSRASPEIVKKQKAT